MLGCWKKSHISLSFIELLCSEQGACQVKANHWWPMFTARAQILGYMWWKMINVQTMAPLVGEKPDLRVLGWSVRQNKVLGITSPQNLSLRTTFIPISRRKAIEELAISQGNCSPETPAESGSEVGWVVSKISSHLCQASSVRWEEQPPMGGKRVVP